MDNQANSADHYFWKLLSKKLSGESSETELNEFQNLLNKNPELQHHAELISAMWDEKSINDQHEGETAYLRHILKFKSDFFSDQHDDSGFNSEGDYQVEKPRSYFRPVNFLFAAILIMVAFTGYFLLTRNKPTDNILSQDNISSVETKNGNRTKILLPDGTQVWLNAGSDLDYNQKLFNQKLREVSLEGEALFDVVKNSQKPFIIHTKNMDIRVLGTVINVKSYNEDKTAEASLIHGAIEIILKNRKNQKIILKPNEKLVVENEISNPEKQVEQKKNQPLVVIDRITINTADSSIEETLWTNNKLVIRSDTFREMANKMERWYDVTIEILDKQLEQKEFNVVFENETIEQALTALSLNTFFKYDIKGKKIVIYR